MEKTVELLKALVKAITSEETKVIESISEEKMELVVIVSEENMPRVIGRNGRVAQNIRNLVRFLKDTNKQLYIRFETEEEYNEKAK